MYYKLGNTQQLSNYTRITTLHSQTQRPAALFTLPVNNCCFISAFKSTVHYCQMLIFTNVKVYCCCLFVLPKLITLLFKKCLAVMYFHYCTYLLFYMAYYFANTSTYFLNQPIFISFHFKKNQIKIMSLNKQKYKHAQNFSQCFNFLDDFADGFFETNLNFV